MLFLMNDRVLDLAQSQLSPGEAATRYRRLTLELVAGLGAEIFADHPRLQETDPDRALALAAMIVAVAPSVNAALFTPPQMGCDPEAVTCRFERTPLAVLDELRREQAEGRAPVLSADNRVWRRLAA